MPFPPYMVAVRRGERVAYYFQVPARLRPQGWKGAIRLPNDQEAAVLMASELKEHLDEARARPAIKSPAEGSLPWLMADYQAGRKWAKLAPKTQHGYLQCAGRVLAWSKGRGDPSVTSLTRPTILRWLSEMDAAPCMRNAVAAFLKLLLRHALDLGVISVNPAEKLGLDRPDRKTAIHIYTDAEIDAFMAAADAAGQPGIGTALLIAAEVGQREGDVLRMRRGIEFQDGEFVFTQAKTGRRLAIPATNKLMRRLSTRTPSLYLAADSEGKPWKEDTFRRQFRSIARTAGLPDCAWFMHGRHTAVARLYRLGFDALAIATITGHSPRTCETIISQHYWERDSEVARGIIQKVNESRMG